MRFLYFYFCVKQISDGENITVTSLWIEVGEEQGEWYFCLGVLLITFLTECPFSSIADAMSVTGVEECKFLMTILSGLSAWS